MSTVELPASFVVWAYSPEARFLKGKTVWANWDVDGLKARKAEIEAGGMLTTTLDGVSAFRPQSQLERKNNWSFINYSYVRLGRGFVTYKMY